MGLGPYWYKIGNKTCYIPKVSKFYVGKGNLWQGLKVSSLTCKCLFYGREHSANAGPHGTEF